MFDHLLGADFQTRNLMLALDAGEPYRIARALAMEAINVATAGGKTERRVRAILADADALAQESPMPPMEFVGWRAGDLTSPSGDGRRPGAATTTDLRNRCAGITWS